MNAFVRFAVCVERPDVFTREFTPKAYDKHDTGWDFER